MASSDSIKRERKGNFSDGELSCLMVEHYAQHAAILQCKLSKAVTNKRKQQIWEGIATEVNARGADRRTVAELRKKVGRNEKRQSAHFVRKTQSENRGSGGKKIPEPWFLTYVLDVLGVNTALVDGIAGKDAKLNKNPKLNWIEFTPPNHSPVHPSMASSNFF